MNCLKQNFIARLLLATGLLAVASDAAAEVHVVEVGDSFFSPSQLTIQAGDTVRWVNAAGGLQHDVESDDGLFSSGPTASQFTYEFTFDTPGTYRYHCSVHGAAGGIGMSGLIVVEAAPAAPFVINPGLNDAWYERETSGQGVLFAVFPDSERMFLAWFTFDTERPPDDVTAILGEPGHRWVTAQGGWQDNVAIMDIVLTTGGVFDTRAPEQETTTGYGSITIEFHDCITATMEYAIPSIPVSGTINLERIVKSGENVALCEAFQDMEGQE